MTVETPERAWNDARVGDLNKKVDEGFEKVDATFREVRKEMHAGFAKVDERFEKVDQKMEAGFARLDDKFDRKFDRLLWVLITLGGSIVAALLAIIGSLNHVHIG